MAKLRPLALLPLAMIAGLGVLAYQGLNRENRQELPTVFIDKPVPIWPDTRLEGFDYAPKEALLGEGLKLVNFWASWCPPCRAEHPNLLALAGEGWQIYGINKEDKPAQAAGFLNELGNPYAGIATDPNGRDSVDWGVYGLPETFLIDAAGRIRLRVPGAVTQRVWQERFVPVIEAIRAE